jgi:hypothetical protein
MLFIYFFLQNKTFLASFTHGIMTVIFALRIIYEGNPLLAEISLFNSIIYFIADLFVRPDSIKIFHHILCSFGFCLALCNSPEVMCFSAKLSGLIETTNPLWTFLRLRIEKSDEIWLPDWYTKSISAIVYILAFFFVRIIWVSSFIYYEIPESFPLWMYHITITPFYLLNMYMFLVLIYKFIIAFNKKYRY